MQSKRALWIVPFVVSVLLTSLFYSEVLSESGNCELDEDHMIVTYVTEGADTDRSDIYVVQADSKVRVNFTSGEEGLNINPSWTSDGVAMAFQSDRDGNWEIYVFYNGHTTNLTQNPADDGNPAWSPDGTHIAFESNRSGNWQIYTYQNNGITQVTKGTGDNHFPVWSPDNRQIAFYSTPIGHQISLLDLTTGVTKTIVDMPAIGQFAWSPDGTQIAFTSGVDENSYQDMYLLTVATGEIINLTNNAFGVEDPRWSPDGSKILFWGGRGEKDQIFVMDRDGQNLKNLSSNDFNDRNPTWSPTGLSIAFESTRETTDTEIINSLYRMSPDGTNVLKLADHVAHFSNLWRPCKPKE